MLSRIAHHLVELKYIHRKKNETWIAEMNGPTRNRVHSANLRSFCVGARAEPSSADTLPIRSPIVDIIEPSGIPAERCLEFQVRGRRIPPRK